MQDDLHQHWYEEKRSAYLYAVMVKHEKHVQHKQLFAQLQLAAEKQAALWATKMHEQSPAHALLFKPDLRCRLIAWLIRHFGTDRVHGLLSAMKIRGMSLFNRFHTEHKHTSFSTANNLRAAIFGMNDGLISNASLMFGMAGAHVSQHTVILSGMAGLLAGACSMGAGEYVSVRSQRELFERQIAIEKEELKHYPEEEAEELKLIYEARGMPSEDATRLAQMMISHPEIGLSTLAREELGLNPDDLVSPWGAMFASFISFAIGAVIPLLPFIISKTAHTIYFSMGLTGLTLFVMGAVLSLYTNRHPLWLGFRMLGIGVIAGCLTFILGGWLGAGI